MAGDGCAAHGPTLGSDAGPDFGDFVSGMQLTGDAYAVEAPSWKVGSVLEVLKHSEAMHRVMAVRPCNTAGCPMHTTHLLSSTSTTFSS